MVSFSLCNFIEHLQFINSLFFFLSFFLVLQSVTLHTNLGDIKCEIFCDEVPKTAEVSAPHKQILFSSGLFSGKVLVEPLFAKNEKDPTYYTSEKLTLKLSPVNNWSKFNWILFRFTLSPKLSVSSVML